MSVALITPFEDTYTHYNGFEDVEDITETKTVHKKLNETITDYLVTSFKFLTQLGKISKVSFTCPTSIIIPNNSSLIISDSGATHHIWNNINAFVSF